MTRYIDHDEGLLELAKRIEYHYGALHSAAICFVFCIFGEMSSMSYVSVMQNVVVDALRMYRKKAVKNTWTLHLHAGARNELFRRQSFKHAIHSPSAYRNAAAAAVSIGPHKRSARWPSSAFPLLEHIGACLPFAVRHCHVSPLAPPLVLNARLYAQIRQVETFTALRTANTSNSTYTSEICTVVMSLILTRAMFNVLCSTQRPQ